MNAEQLRIWGQNLIQQYWVGRLDKRIPVYATLIALLLLAQSFATITWKLFPVPNVAGIQGSAITSTRNTVAKTNNQPVAQKIAQWHLLGKYVKDVPKAAPVQQVEAAPETKLNLKLRGVFASSNKANDRAIIADAKNKEESYKIGDLLPGNATLVKVFNDKVVLDRNGRLETLKLPVEVPASDNTSANQSSSNRNRRSPPRPGQFTPSNNAETSTLLKEYRTALLNDPQSVMGLLRAEPYRKNGQLKGYRVRPGKDRQLLRKFGLRSGDVVTSVNGVPMDNPLKALELMRDLSSATSLTIDIERRGVPQSFTFQIE